MLPSKEQRTVEVGICPEEVVRHHADGRVGRTASQQSIIHREAVIATLKEVREKEKKPHIAAEAATSSLF